MSHCLFVHIFRNVCLFVNVSLSVCPYVQECLSVCKCLIVCLSICSGMFVTRSEHWSPGTGDENGGQTRSMHNVSFILKNTHNFGDEL
jgi:hypothetical protein